MNASPPRLLGAAFLIVVATSLSGGLFLSLAAGSGSISDVLVAVSSNPTVLQASVLAELLTSLGIIVLAALLYVVLRSQSKVVALAALGLWLAEAIVLAISRLGALALIPLSEGFVEAGAPQASFYQALGEFLYAGLVQQGYLILMFFYCAGGLLWYALFYRSRYVPRAIALFGLAAVSVGLVGIVLEIFGAQVPFVVFLPILPFELTIGAWLLLRGIPATAPRSERPSERALESGAA